MKTFWIILGLLACLTTAFVVVEMSGSKSTSNSDLEQAQSVEPAPVVEQPATSSAPAQEATATAQEPVSPKPAVPSVDEAIANVDRAIAELTQAPANTTQPESTPTTPPTTNVAPTTPVTPAEPTTASNVTDTIPVKIEPAEDGWTRVDDRFLIRGTGTKEDPYLLSWDMLVSASETFRPRLGRKVMPERITMLNGKYVRVSGFVLFPMMMQEAKELLLMRNQWDGCCIGVPPTPYDAVEIKLVDAATRTDMYVQNATLEGLMKVDPYINRDWLLGLYVIENAKILKMSDEGVIKPTHPPGQGPGAGLTSPP